MEKLIHIEDLSIAYQNKPVIWDIDLDVPNNVLMAIVGPNGAGKSTLLKGILGLIPHLTGKVLIKNQPVKKIYKQIAYVPQISNVNWDFPTTVLDVVLMGRYPHLNWFRRPSKSDKKKALEALKMIQMDEFANRQINQLSGGQKQRVFLARAIVQEADLYFLDEPLQGIDAKSETIIFDILKHIHQQGKTIVAVHHDLKTVEKYFDYIVFINKKVIAQGNVDSTFTQQNIEKTYLGINDDSVIK